MNVLDRFKPSQYWVGFLVGVIIVFFVVSFFMMYLEFTRSSFFVGVLALINRFCGG